MGKPKSYADHLVGRSNGIGSPSNLHKSLPHHEKLLFMHALKKRIEKHSITLAVRPLPPNMTTQPLVPQPPPVMPVPV